MYTVIQWTNPNPNLSFHCSSPLFIQEFNEVTFLGKRCGPPNMGVCSNVCWRVLIKMFPTVCRTTCSNKYLQRYKCCSSGLNLEWAWGPWQEVTADPSLRSSSPLSVTSPMDSGNNLIFPLISAPYLGAAQDLCGTKDWLVLKHCSSAK